MNTENPPPNALVTLLAGISQPSEMEQVLEALLTPKEREELDNRLKIFQRLLEGMPQREIAAQLNVGIATVTRGASALKKHRAFIQDRLTHYELIPHSSEAHDFAASNNHDQGLSLDKRYP